MMERFPSHRGGLTADQVAVLREAMGRFSVTAVGRGTRYYEQGRVVDVMYGEDSVGAVVLDTKEYEVDWFWNDAGCISNCSCPVDFDCKHAYALGVYILAWVPTRLVTAATPTKPKQEVVAPPDLAARLGAQRDPWLRREILRRVLTAPPLSFSFYDRHAEDILSAIHSEQDPELQCWMLACRLLPLAHGVLPAELESYRERSDLQERHALRERRKLASDIVAWVSNRKKTASRSLRFVWTLLQQPGGGFAFVGEARLTSARLNDEVRTDEQLRQLLAEAQSKPGTLASEQELLLASYFEATPHFGLGAGLVGRATSPATAVAMLKSLDHESAAMTWATDIALEISRRAGITPATPLRLAAQPLRVLPSAIAVDDGARIELICLWDDGRQRSLADVLYFPSDSYSYAPGFVLADGYFFTVVEEPPKAVRDRFVQLGGLHIPRTQCAEVLTPLAQHFDHVRDSLAAHRRWVSGMPIVALDLRDDDWLQIRLFVYDGDDLWLPHQTPPAGAVVFELAPTERWQRWHGPPPEEGGDGYEPIRSSSDVEASIAELSVSDSTHAILDDAVWIEAPDPETVAPALAWLAATAAQPGSKGGTRGSLPDAPDRDIGWWMKASARRMGVFAELWETRPATVQFFGTERVQRLLSAAQTVRPKLSITSSGLDWFAVSAEWEAEGMLLSDADMAKLRSSTSRFVKLASGWVRRDAVEAHDATTAVLADLGIEVGGGEQRVTLWQLAGAKPESLAALEQMGANRDTIQALSNLRHQLRKFRGVPQVPVPNDITAELRPYQKHGLDFLAYTSDLGIGVVLADDMGLGKTLQALAWLQTLVNRDPQAGPCLVVCPTSVMHNWEREAAQFAPKLRVQQLARGEERHALRKDIARFDLVITNYALLRRDLEQWKGVELRAVILDEAQNIKNPDAAVSKAAFALGARHRLALTGTPLENRLLDLWSISNFVNPGYLGNRSQFGVRFDRIDAAPHARTLLAAKLRPVLLRRLKREVAADLPERIEERRDCELTEGQRQLYLAELRRSRKLIDELSDDPSALRKNKITILAALTRLRQICCHPVLAKGKASLGSGKFEALFELLEPLLAEGHKVLLFSQFVQCLALIEKEMGRRDIAHHKLTGATLKREAVVQTFQDDPRPCVFLISLKAGGTGLNLTAASYVVLFDPWWNPAVEAQAIDRTHRIGQDRTVIAYRMLALGTIEEKIWELQQKKSAMVHDILGEDGFARALSRDDLSFLLQEV